MSEQFKLEMARMTALAERFAAEGQMNLNKLTEAAVYAQIRRAGWQYRPPVAKDRMQTELSSVIQALKQSKLSSDLVSAMEIGLDGLQSGHGGDILYEAAPDIFVCRTCGHVALGQAANHCPDCGSWPGRFRKFVAFFNGDNRDPLNPMMVLDLMEESVTAVNRLVGGLPEEATSRQPSPDEWSIRDHLAHFYDTQEMLDVRVSLMLEHDDPDLTALAVYELATETERHPSTAQGILEVFSQKRLACVERLRSRPLNDLYRTGQHPEFGQMTILRQAAYLAYHEQDHLPEIEALCQNVP